MVSILPARGNMVKQIVLISAVLSVIGILESCKKKSGLSPSSENTDEILVQEAKSNLDERTLAMRPCETTNQITHDFGVLTKTTTDVTIDWSSNRPDILSIVDGIAKVTTLTQTQEVLLTATLAKGTATATKEFTLTVVPSLTATDSTEPNLFFLGFARNGTDNYFGGFWHGGLWTGYSLTSPDPSKSFKYGGIEKSGGDIYVPGELGNEVYFRIPGYWKNGSWTPLESVPRAQITSVLKIKVSGEDVYAVGSQQGQVSGGYADWIYGYWKNTSWVDELITDTTNPRVEATSLAIVGSDVYVSGTQAEGSLNHQSYAAGYSKNGTWQLLENPYVGTNSYGRGIAVFGNDIYVYGKLESHAGYWKNGNWIPLTTPNSLSATVTGIIMSGDDLYAIGELANGSKGYWKNGTWVKSTTNAPSLIHGCDIYAVGNKIEAGITIPGFWKNDEWHALTPPDPTRSAEVVEIRQE